MKYAKHTFASEAELVAAFSAYIDAKNAALSKRLKAEAPEWVIYHETADWDLLLVSKRTGIQIGIEAKLSLNPKVLEQALPRYEFTSGSGPDYRAVLVPSSSCQAHMQAIASYIGIKVLALRQRVRGERREEDCPFVISGDLPDESERHSTGADYGWHSWCPDTRCALPDYVPDVMGGHPSPLRLTPWKIKAIKLVILLDRAGVVTRKQMKAIGISPTFWTAPGGFLQKGEGGYIRSGRTPNLRDQHPVNYAEIEADFDAWGKPLLAPGLTPAPALV